MECRAWAQQAWDRAALEGNPLLGMAAPEPLPGNHTRWASNLDPRFSQSPLTGITKRMLDSYKV